MPAARERAVSRRSLSFFVRMRNEDGFTLIEAIVAIGIAAGVLLALGAALATGVRANLTGRQNQTASDVATQQLEAIRQLPFAAAELVTSDLTGDSRITAGNFDPGTGTAEPVYAGTSGSVNPHIKTVTVNSTPYTVSTYVTIPTDAAHAGASTYYHRLTVVVSWKVSGVTHNRSASTFLVNTERGLPLPRFAMTWVSTSDVGCTGTAPCHLQSVGATPYWGFFVRNLGAPDAFNITASSGSWTYYVDTNGNGLRDAGEDTRLGTGSYDFDLNNTPDTGQLQPNTSIYVVAVRNTALTAAEAGTSSVVAFTATSAAQPTASTASRTLNATQSVSGSVASPSPTPSATSSASPSASPTPTVAASASPNPPPTATVTGGTLRTYYFHNYIPNSTPSAGATTTQATMLMDQNTPTNTGFYNYSTEQSDNVYGRYLGPGGTDQGTVSTKQADWRFQAPSKMTFNGTATVTVYVLCVGSTGPVTLRASIGESSNGTAQSGYGGGDGFGNATMTTCSTTTWTPLTIGVPLTDTITNNKWLTVRIYIPSASDPSVRLLYDASPNYMAAAVLPQVAP